MAYEVVECFKANGYACEIIRAGLGHLNGYVLVPAGHPAHGKDTDALGDINVHGGVTWADAEKDGTWRIGFDTAHAGDAVPGLPRHSWDTVRTVEYVRGEVESLASQLRDMVDS